MALFKIKKGVKANLPTSYVEGYCYFTTDDGKFYIDTSNASSGRVCLNAGAADKLTSNAGSATQPVYFSGGKPVAITGNIANGTTGNAATATKLATARTISLTGGATGTATSFDGSRNISVPVTSVSPNYISDGYTTKGFYINTHPENSPTIIPFINNDIAFLLKRGGSAVVKYDGAVQSVDISNVFDGSPSYWYMNLNGVTNIIIELTLHKEFTWTNTIYIDSGSNGWRAKNVKIEVMNTNYADDIWTQKGMVANHPYSQYKVTFSHKPVGASNEGGGFNKIRLTFSDWNSSTTFRIAAIGVINYGSFGLRETFLPKDGGSVYGDITPYSNNTFNLGSSPNKWKNIYATTFIGALSGNAATATKLATARTISLTGSVTGSGSFDGSGNLSITTTTNHTHDYVPISRTINGKALSSNISLTYSDVGAAAASHNHSAILYGGTSNWYITPAFGNATFGGVQVVGNGTTLGYIYIKDNNLYTFNGSGGSQTRYYNESNLSFSLSGTTLYITKS